MLCLLFRAMTTQLVGKQGTACHSSGIPAEVSSHLAANLLFSRPFLWRTQSLHYVRLELMFTLRLFRFFLIKIFWIFLPRSGASRFFFHGIQTRTHRKRKCFEKQWYLNSIDNANYQKETADIFILFSDCIWSHRFRRSSVKVNRDGRF